MDSKRLRAHKIRLYPNNKQLGYLKQSSGTARFAYNWGLSTWNTWYQEYSTGTRTKKPNHRDIRNHLNKIKREEYPWLLDVSKCVPQEAIAQLGDSWKRYFTHQNKRPKFKKRGISKDSFKITGDHIKIKGKGMRLPKCDGVVKMAERLRFDGRIISVTVSRAANRWYASVLVELPELPQKEPDSSVRDYLGIDLGVQEYVTSDGLRYPVPREYRQAEASLKRAQQSLSRKVRGSRNYEKAKNRVALAHLRVSDKRADWLHKLSAGLSQRNRNLVLEDLNVTGMLGFSRGLAKSVSDAGFAEFRRQVSYKVERYDGHSVVITDRWFASSKLCSGCGAKAKHLSLGTRVWVCDQCGVQHDRDVNAAVNLEYYAGGSSVSACGQLYASVVPSIEGVTSVLVETGIDHHSLTENV